MRKAEQHSFDIALAVKVGVEKAILLGSIQYWISENEKRKSEAHFQQGEYWTYDTASGLSEKYPYLNAKSIHRWMVELEKEEWIKKDYFKVANSGKTTWYGRGVKLKVWLGYPISQNEIFNSQNEECNSQNEISISQNEISISQNEISISQNEEFPYNKDTVVNSVQTTVNHPLTPSTAGEGILAVEAEEVNGSHFDAEQIPPTPSSAAPLPPLSTEEQGEFDAYLRKLQTDRRLIEGLSRLYGLRGEEALTWIERYVTSQWAANNLTGRNNKDLITHCQSWIETKLTRQKEREQQQSNRQNNGRGPRQSRAETGSEIDRLAEEFFGS